MTFILTLAAALLAGLALTLIGLRGRRADDHRLCRRCGFDLTGTPAAAVCNECGADLTRPRAIKVGHRVRRRLPLAIGLALLVPCVLVAALAGYVAARGVDVQAYKPAWLLSRELRSGDAPTRDAAVAELAGRLKADELSADAAAGVVEWALAMQADRDREWKPLWGGLIESARTNAKASDAQWQRFARGAFTPMLRVRDGIRQGDVLPMQIDFDQRVGLATTWLVHLDADDLRVGGRGVGQAIDSGMIHAPGFVMASDAGLTADGDVTGGLNIGAARATGRARLVIGPAGPGAASAVPMSAGAVPPLARVEADLSADLTVRGRDEPANYSTGDESLRPGVESRVWITPVRLQGAPAPATPAAVFGVAGVTPPVTPPPGPWEVGVRVGDDDKDVRLNYDVLLRRPDGRETRGADGGGYRYTESPAGVRSRYESSRFPDDALDGVGPRGTVTVILRPNLDHVARWLDATPVWGRDVVFENVPVERAEEVAPGRDWKTGPWQSPGGAVIDPDAAAARAAAAAAPVIKPAVKP